MKKVIFKKISAQNFLSVGNTPLILNFQSGVSLITGENRDEGGRNGVGKSTVVESLYWSLFGETMREIKRERVIHRNTGSDCKVELEFDIVQNSNLDSYTLIRSAEPNKVKLFRNNEDITLSSMPKTDELIKELIGATPEVFQNAIIMSTNNTLPFMAQKKVDKRKFVEGVLHLGIFGEMLLQIRQEYNEVKKQNDLICNQFSEKQKNLEIYKNQSDKFQEKQKNKLVSLQTRIEEINIQVKEMQDKVSNTSSIQTTKNDLQKLIEKKESKIEQLQELADNCTKQGIELSSKIQSLTTTIKQNKVERDKLLQTNVNCPVCQRAFENIDEIHIKNLLDEKNSSIQIDEKLLEFTKTEQKKQNANCEIISNTISKLLKDIRTHEKELNELNLIHQEVNQLLSRSKELENEIDIIKKEPDQFQTLIESVEISIKEIEDEIISIQKQLSVLETAKFVVSEEGVKTYIVKKMLNVLNSRLNFYLQALDSPCKCEFNEMFEEIIYDSQNRESSYFNFSGGERKRIDLAILFMFQDILRMQTGTSFSISMYDELFDSAIDEKGVNKAIDILKDRVEKYGENIYIISHNKEAIKSGIDQVILLEKQNGETRLA